jgi:hypothetical protein
MSRGFWPSFISASKLFAILDWLDLQLLKFCKYLQTFIAYKDAHLLLHIFFTYGITTHRPCQKTICSLNVMYLKQRNCMFSWRNVHPRSVIATFSAHAASTQLSANGVFCPCDIPSPIRNVPGFYTYPWSVVNVLPLLTLRPPSFTYCNSVWMYCH